MTNKKTWFVYLTDHHEGPYSAHEIFQMYYRQEISDESLVWAEGMDKWVLLKDCRDLQDILIPDRENYPEIYDLGPLAQSSPKELSPYANHLTQSEEDVILKHLPKPLKELKKFQTPLYERRASSPNSEFYKWLAPVLIFAMICVIMIPVLFFRDTAEEKSILSFDEVINLESKDDLSFLKDLTEKDYKKLESAARARVRDGAKMALYASTEKQKIWLASNIAQRAILNATFTSIEARVLSKTPIVIKVSASLDQHFAFFDKLDAKFVPGYYDVSIEGEFLGDDDFSFKDKLIRLAESLIPARRDAFKRFFYKGRVFFADETISDFALALKKFHEDKSAPYRDLLERYKVLDSLLEKVSTLYEEKFKSKNFAREIASFESDYSSELSHVFQEIVIDAEKKKSDQEMGKDYEKISSLGREIGKLVAVIIEKSPNVAKSARASEKAKKDLLRDLESRRAGIKKNLTLSIKTLEEKIKEFSQKANL